GRTGAGRRGRRRSPRAATKRGRRFGGSARKPLPGARRVGAVPSDEPVEGTVLVRPRALLPPPEGLAGQPLRERRYLTRREYAARYGAAPKDLAAVADFATEHGLRVRQ